MKIAFFPMCMVDMLYPEVGVAAVNVLERLGCELEMPEEQVCCGQGLINSGYTKEMIPAVEFLTFRRCFYLSDFRRIIIYYFFILEVNLTFSC